MVERKKVLVTRDLPGDALSQLKGVSDFLIEPPTQPLSRERLLEVIPKADALICLLSETIDQTVMDRAKNLKVISNYAVGYNNIDLEYATQKGIYVTNTPDVLTEATADLAWALMLAAARRVVEGDKMVRSGNFKGWTPDLLLGSEVYGKTLGVIGLGRIGSAVIKRAKGFGMPVIYWSREKKTGFKEQLDLEYMSLPELLKKADFISVNVALTPQTRHLIGQKEFSLMKKNAIIVNTARGPIIDEEALAEALKTGLIKAAGLDVYENEPDINPELRELDNVVFTPHVGSGTEETRAKMAQMVVDDVLLVLKGQKPLHAIN